MRGLIGSRRAARMTWACGYEGTDVAEAIALAVPDHLHRQDRVRTLHTLASSPSFPIPPDAISHDEE